MKKIISIFILLAATLNYTLGQTLDDALRFSHTSYTGTARSAAMGNAFGALGGDFTSLSINPAGIAIYRSSEFSISPSVIFNNTSAMYTGINTEFNDTSWPFNQGGFVWTNKTFSEGDRGIVSTHFAFGYNRSNNLNQDMMTNGKALQSTLLGEFVIESEGVTPGNLNQFGSELAYNTWLLDTLPGINDSYFNAFEGIDGNGDIIWRADKGLDQKETTYKDGYSGEYLFTFGINISQKLMIGATMGIQSIQYTESSNYTEVNTYGLTPGYNTDLNYYNYYNYLHQTGTGFNFKFGIIARPFPMLRLGAAVHTPTYYNIWENWNSSIEAHYLDNAKFTESSPYGEYNYKFRTPLKAIGSAALILGKYMILSFDYEFQGYKSTEFKPLGYADDYLWDLNRQINEKFKNTNNFRLGLEVKMTPNVGIRAGFSTQESPYKKEYENKESTFYTYSGGIGYRTLRYFVDVAYMLSIREFDYFHYNWDSSWNDYYGTPEPARIKSNDNQIILTLGYKF